MTPLNHRALSLALLRHDLILANERAESLTLPDVASLVRMAILAIDAEPTTGVEPPQNS
jgi:hypothetical protein